MYRWIELEAFGSAIFRSHIGSLVSPRNVQIYHDKEVMLFFGKFTNIFKHLAGYRKTLMKEAHEKGWPLMRSMAAHFGEDVNTWSLSAQYMFGSEFMITPVMDPVKSNYNHGSKSGQNSISLVEFADYTVKGVKVYIPAKSNWIHLWTGQEVSGGEKGRYVSVDAPFGCLPVFYTVNSVYGKQLREFILENKYDAVSTVIPSSTNTQSTNHINNDIQVTEVPFTLSDSTATTTSTTSQSPSMSSHHISNHNPKKSKHVPIQSTVWSLEKPQIGSIVPYLESTWYDWFGISQYLSIPSTTTNNNDYSTLNQNTHRELYDFFEDSSTINDTHDTHDITSLYTTKMKNIIDTTITSSTTTGYVKTNTQTNIVQSMKSNESDELESLTRSSLAALYTSQDFGSQL